MTALSYVRFHGIFNDELGVYTEAANGEALYNFSYVDQVYYWLLANGARPIVELSFMPAQLASSNIRHSFLVPSGRLASEGLRALGCPDCRVRPSPRGALRDRRGEPLGLRGVEFYSTLDLPASRASPPTPTLALRHRQEPQGKRSPRLRVGGPATAQAAWVAAFIRHCQENHVPVDFISTHVYGDDSAKDVFGSAERIPRGRMVCRAVQKVHAEIKSSPLPELPLLWTEFNATFRTQTEVTDAPFMGPWLAANARDWCRTCPIGPSPTCSRSRAS